MPDTEYSIPGVVENSLYTLRDARPELASRIARAEEILARQFEAGVPRPIRARRYAEGQVVYVVRAANREGEYLIRAESWSCDCPDAEPGCKHVIACWVLALAEKKQGSPEAAQIVWGSLPERGQDFLDAYLEGAEEAKQERRGRGLTAAEREEFTASYRAKSVVYAVILEEADPQGGVNAEALAAHTTRAKAAAALERGRAEMGFLPERFTLRIAEEHTVPAEWAKVRSHERADEPPCRDKEEAVIFCGRCGDVITLVDDEFSGYRKAHIEC